MLKDIVEARVLEGYNVYLKYEDGVEGEIDLADIIKFESVFEPLKEPERFRELYLDKEFGTICWPCGADLDPDVLYAMLTKTAIPSEGSRVSNH